MAGWVSGEASVLCFQMAAFSLCLYMTFSLSVHTPDVSSSHKDTSPIWLGPTLMSSFNLNYLFKDPVSKHSDIGVQASMYAFCSGKHNSVYNTHLLFLSTTPLHLVGMLYVWNPSYAPTHLPKKGESFKPIYKRILPLTEGHSWYYAKGLVITTLQIIEISQHSFLRSPLFVWFIYSGATCLRQSNSPSHTHTLPIAEGPSIYTAPSHSILILPLYLQPCFPRPGMIIPALISLFNSSPFCIIHAKTYFLP